MDCTDAGNASTSNSTAITGILTIGSCEVSNCYTNTNGTDFSALDYAPSGILAFSDTPIIRDCHFEINGKSNFRPIYIHIATPKIDRISPLPTCSLVKQSNQNVSTTTITKITYNTTQDAGYPWNDGSNAEITVPYTGLYAVNIFGSWTSNSTGDRMTYLRVNGATIRNDNIETNSSTGNYRSVDFVLKLDADDYLTHFERQTSGITLDWCDSADPSQYGYFTATYLGSLV